MPGLWISGWISTGWNVQNTRPARQAKFYPTTVQRGYTVFQCTCKPRKCLNLFVNTTLSTKNSAFTITTKVIYIPLCKTVNVAHHVDKPENRQHCHQAEQRATPFAGDAKIVACCAWFLKPLLLMNESRRNGSRANLPAQRIHGNLSEPSTRSVERFVDRPC